MSKGRVIDKSKLINVLLEYKEKLLIEKLNYKELDISNLEDVAIVKEVSEFDTSKKCFGDYSLFDDFDYYTNYAIYFENELIGFLGYTESHPKDTTRIIPCLCIKEKYRNIGIGYIIINQLLNNVFEYYDDIKSIYLTIIENNIPSIRLAKSLGFYGFPGYRENDYIQVNGTLEKQNHYLYKRKDYEKNKKEHLPYGDMKFK